MITAPSISVIVSTYNAQGPLSVCLSSFARQTDPDFELIVVEDGDFPSTRALIDSFQQRGLKNVTYTSQEDIGFRAARSRNLGIRASKAPYIIFVDGDCFVLPDFIASHRQMAQKGFFVSGKRSFLRHAITQDILHCSEAPSYSRFRWFVLGLLSHATRLFEFIPLPDGKWRYNKATEWKTVQTCNLGVWKEDIVKINGFDNRYMGHGLEDSDFVVRLVNSGVKRKRGDFCCLVLHLEHERRQRPAHSPNATLFEHTLSSPTFKAEEGLKEL